MIFDTHTHYDDSAFDGDRDEIIARLKNNNVGRICNIGSTLYGAKESVRLSEKYDFVYAAAGIHPDEVYDFYPGLTPEKIEALFRDDSKMNFENANLEGEGMEKDSLKFRDEYAADVFDTVRKLAEKEKTVAVGEIGLDYHGFGVFEIKPGKAIQKYWFIKQLKLAIELEMPVVIHSRNASEDTLKLMEEAHMRGLKSAVIHCYSYSKETALKYVEMGFYLGFGGVITYEGQKKVTKALEAVPLDRILIETDCPYLAPVPIRKKDSWVRNESAYLNHVIDKAAEIKGITSSELEKITWDNANRFYGI